MSADRRVLTEEEILDKWREVDQRILPPKQWVLTFGNELISLVLERIAAEEKAQEDAEDVAAARAALAEPGPNIPYEKARGGIGGGRSTAPTAEGVAGTGTSAASANAPRRHSDPAQDLPQINPLRTRPDYDFRCQRCGAPHNLDTSIPSAIWNQIVERASPSGDKYGALCTLCIDDLMAEKGLTGEAEFYFEGEALRSKSYDKPTQGDVEKAIHEALSRRSSGRVDPTEYPQILDEVLRLRTCSPVPVQGNQVCEGKAVQDSVPGVENGRQVNPADADVERLRERAHEASGHLLIFHANTDKGTPIKDQVGQDRGVMHHSFDSPCTQPHECWNNLEALINSLADAAGTLAHDRNMLAADADRLQRELDDAKGVIR